MAADTEIFTKDTKTSQSDGMTERTITNREEIAKIMSNTYPMSAFDHHPFTQYQSNAYYTVYFIEKNTAEDDHVTTIDRAYPQP